MQNQLSKDNHKKIMQSQLSKDNHKKIMQNLPYTSSSKKFIIGICGDMLTQNMVEHFSKQLKMVLYVFIKVHPFQFVFFLKIIQIS